MAQILERGAAVSIDGEDYHHLTRSLRAKVGEELLLVDAQAGRFKGLLESIDRHGAQARAVEALDPQPPLAPLSLALCAPKSEAFDASLDAATQLGVTRFVPLHSQRSQPIHESKQGRWQRLVRESCCQSLRAKPMEISEPLPLAGFLAQARSGRKFIAWQGGAALASGFGADEALSLLVGPEGGFDPAELALAAQAGWETLSLGPRILRVPVAVSAALGLLQGMRRA